MMQCMHTVCKATSNAILHSLLIHVHTFPEMYIHVRTILILFIHVWNMYVHGHGTYIFKYKHVCTLFVRVTVRACIHMYIHILTCINMCIPCTNRYRHVCNIFVIYIPVYQCLCNWHYLLRWIHTFHQIYIHHSTMYVHRCKLLVSAFWFARLAGLQVGTPGVTPIQAH